MAKTKIVDVYQNAEIVAEMVNEYKEAETDEERAAVVQEWSEKLGKSPASVRQKLVREGVYIAKERTSKDGSEVISKGKLVDQIAEALGITLTESEATSLEKATKQTLKKILEAAMAKS